MRKQVTDRMRTTPNPIPIPDGLFRFCTSRSSAAPAGDRLAASEATAAIAVARWSAERAFVDSGLTDPVRSDELLRILIGHPLRVGCSVLFARRVRRHHHGVLCLDWRRLASWVRKSDADWSYGRVAAERLHPVVPAGPHLPPADAEAAMRGARRVQRAPDAVTAVSRWHHRMSHS